mmetsp:Transcript_81818/g.236458  ORF Transcript_81818/g.236458 Transcript_81818/m.236458 type:complete len:219 (-) Transcript_81818:66-722(-)
MELHVVDSEGIPEGCVLSVRAGSTRRQAPLSADRPFRFPTAAADAIPFKVDVLEPVASARLILRPGEEQRTDCQYTIPLKPAGSQMEDDLEAEAKPTDKKMSVTIAVAPTDGKADPDKDAGDDSRPGTAPDPKRAAATAASASSRHGQANAAREYLDKHNLVEFTQLLVQSVIKEQPDRPYAFMAKQFYFPEPEPRKDAGGAAAKAAPEKAAAAPAAP